MVRMLCVVMAFAACVTVDVAHGRDLLALTQDERIVRIAPAAPGTLKLDRPVESWNNVDGLGLTWSGDDLWVPAASTRVMLDLGQPAHLAVRWYPIPSWSLAGTRAFAARPDGRMVGTTTSSLVTLDSWPNGGVEVTEPLPAGLDLVAAAFAGATHYAIDAATDRLVARAPGGAFTPVGPLGVDVGARAGLEVADGAGWLASGGVLHRVDLATGEATAVGAIGTGETVLDLAVVPPPYLIIEGNNVRPYVAEPEGRALVTLTRRGDADEPLTVPWTTFRAAVPNAAEPGLDFVPASGVATLAAGVHAATIEIPLIDDDELEPVEHIGLRFDQAGGPRDQLLQLWDDLGDAQFAVGETTVSELAGKATVQVRRASASGPATVPVTVGGTAKAGVDFGPVPPAVSFAAGETAKTLAVPIIANKEAEQPETIVLQLGAGAATRQVNPLRRTTIAISDVAQSHAGGRDRTKPKVTFVGSSRMALRRAMKVRVRCSEACRLGAELRHGITLAKGTATTRRQGTATVTLRLSAKTLRRVRRSTPLRATLRVTARDVGGNTRIARRTLTLRR